MNKKRYLVIVGIVAAAVLLSILFYPLLANHRPAITSLAAERERVPHRGSCQIVCNVTDPDGDTLTYGWSADGAGITGEGATVTWTAPDSEGLYNVTVTVNDGRGGKAIDYVTIEVIVNRSPTIKSLIADPDWTTPSGSLNVTCDAFDRDGDELSYEWTASGGYISGTGPVVNWTAPQAIGPYNVTVVVGDVYGGEATTFVRVTLGPPPIIENLIVTAKEPKYLVETTPGYNYKVWKTKEYDIEIECIASNTSGELAYEWSCTGGNISGEGSMITWTAPNQSPVDVTVTVMVSDVAGNRVSKDIVFTVPFCACGF